MAQSVNFYYYGVDKNTGNKGKYNLCFKHAVELAIKNSVITIETEIADDDYYFCDECGK